ncbi:MAG: helix-turn-helix transcriptional regulator [Aerococcus urinaeequi]
METQEMKNMISKNLHRLMAHKGLHATALSKVVSISYKKIVEFIEGTATPNPEQVKLLADALGADVDEFYK